LIARPGARFRCFGDGLCCTDIHALGPVTMSEARELRARRKLSVVYSEDVEGFCVAPAESGGCVYLDTKGCTIHRKEGPEKKPTGCQRFPYGLAATPIGGRVTTEHRCPCRTLGERPALSLQDAERSLLDRAGRLEVDRVVPARIEITEGVRIAFAQYAELEATLIARLNAGERAERVLEQAPLPELRRKSWFEVAAEHLEAGDGSAGGETLIWFGDALLQLHGGHKPPKRARPWLPAFERAMARTRERVSCESIYNDWLADELWMFRWLPWGPLDVGLAELATRLAVARTLQRRVQALGAREDQAAAEAVMICELAAEGSSWPVAVDDIAPEPPPGPSWLARLRDQRASRRSRRSPSSRSATR
jgi:hypothetical protein